MLLALGVAGLGLVGIEDMWAVLIVGVIPGSVRERDRPGNVRVGESGLVSSRDIDDFGEDEMYVSTFGDETLRYDAIPAPFLRSETIDLEASFGVGGLR